jgi:23S rRNA pseudouridine1911/1915/1917 synthase
MRHPNQRIPDPAGTLELRGRGAVALDCGPAGWQIHPRVNLLHLDAALAAVNKGPGLISVPAPGCPFSALSILADFLAGRLRALERGAAGRSLPTPYRRLQPLPVHRLDQYTSGVFCLAMNPIARARLILQLKARTIRREYVAYADGRPPHSHGTWRNWLKLSEDESRQFILSAAQARLAAHQASEAITHYEVIAEFPLAAGRQVITKLRLRLETGRKHQIRAQAAYAGLPLLGDRTYHPHYHPDAPQAPRIEFPRQALHAEVLSLEHPGQPGVRLTWRAALPQDLRRLEAELRTQPTVP